MVNYIKILLTCFITVLSVVDVVT